MLHLTMTLIILLLSHIATHFFLTSAEAEAYEV